MQAEKQNHQNVMAGNRVIIPLVIYIPRDPTVSYVMLAMANIHEEHRPWAISIVIAPCHPQAVLDKIPAVAKPMWLTEEYAIRAFTSDCRIQINLVMAPPIKEIDVTNGVRAFLRNMNFTLIRNRPYLPSFRRMPARTIEPATGASTCALGNQR